MDSTAFTAVERIQTLSATIIATHPAGHQLCLIGGFRYRLLNASARTSTDIDYHWEGDLQRKQMEIVDVLRGKLLPEVKRQFGYDGDVRPGSGPGADSPAVRIVETAFYRVGEFASRIEIPIEITSVARLDPPTVRTIAGTVFLTVSDADMIESKILAFLDARFCRVRDVLDIFLFRDALPRDAPARLAEKLQRLAQPPAGGEGEKGRKGRETGFPSPLLPFSPSPFLLALDRFEANRRVRVRELERLLDEQVAPAVAANLRAAGGATMIWDAVLSLLRETFTKAGDLSP